MKITLNGLELARTAHGEQTVGEILNELKDEIRRGGKIITQIVLDGRMLTSNWQRGRLLATKADDAVQLDLTIEDPVRLKRQTVYDATRLVDRLVQQSKPLGRKFRIGDEVGANNDLAAYLDDLKWILAGLDHTTRDTDNPAHDSASRQRILERVGQLLPTLDRIYKAQAAGDYIAIADEIEYDLFDQLNSWAPLLEEVQESLESLTQEK
ncbi:MAG: hypothetical protein ACOZB3_03570 [Calditrichota bacterium]